MMIDRHCEALATTSIKLPKLFAHRNFRIRSASKEKFKQNMETIRSNRKTPKQNFLSSDKYDQYRSSSIKSTKKRSIKTKKSQCNGSSEEQPHLENESKMNFHHLKTDIKNYNQTISRDSNEQFKKLDSVAKLFDPKTIMKMGKKHHGDHSNENSQSKNKRMGGKGSIRMKQLMYEENKHKTKQRNSQNGCQQENEEFWRQVNQSLILSPMDNGQEVSKDLLQIYQTFVTE